MKTTIEIQMDNAAFANYPEQELARMLRDLAEKVEFDRDPALDQDGDLPIRDINGNTVGALRVDMEGEK